MLTVITGTTEVLMDELKHSPEALQTAVLVNQAADRCTELIRHLLAFARKQPLRPRNVDINSTILDIAKLLRPTLGEHVEIDSILEQEVATAHIDASQLANSLVNMAINARDAMPDGGKLLLETRNIVLEEAYARNNPDVIPGPYVMLAVSDSGTGMSAAVRDRAFEPFFTTKRGGKGSGLGLSMVYGFVKQSGGHINIYSEEGHGTTIRLYLPPARLVESVPAPPVAPIRNGHETILVVEDDVLVRDFVVAQLRGLGYTTIAAGDGREALSHVLSGAAFDLLYHPPRPSRSRGAAAVETLPQVRACPHGAHRARRCNRRPARCCRLAQSPMMTQHSAPSPPLPKTPSRQAAAPNCRLSIKGIDPIKGIRRSSHVHDVVQMNGRAPYRGKSRSAPSRLTRNSREHQFRVDVMHNSIRSPQ